MLLFTKYSQILLVWLVLGFFCWCCWFFFVLFLLFLIPVWLEQYTQWPEHSIHSLPGATEEVELWRGTLTELKSDRIIAARRWCSTSSSQHLYIPTLQMHLFSPCSTSVSWNCHQDEPAPEMRGKWTSGIKGIFWWIRYLDQLHSQPGKQGQKEGESPGCQQQQEEEEGERRRVRWQLSAAPSQQSTPSKKIGRCLWCICSKIHISKDGNTA